MPHYFSFPPFPPPSSPKMGQEETKLVSTSSNTPVVSSSTGMADPKAVPQQTDNVNTSFGPATESVPSAGSMPALGASASPILGFTSFVGPNAPVVSCSTSMADSKPVSRQTDNVNTSVASSTELAQSAGSVPASRASAAPTLGFASFVGPNAFAKSLPTSISDSQSVFGRASGATTNPSAQRPFHTVNPLIGASTNGSQFGASSVPAVGSALPLGASTVPFFLLPSYAAVAYFASTSVSDSRSVFGQMNSVSTNPSIERLSCPVNSSIGCSTEGLSSGSSSAPSVGSAPAFGISTAPSGLSSYSGGFPSFGQKPSFQVTSPSTESYPFGGTLQRTQFALGRNTSLPDTLSGSSNQLALDLPVPQGAFLLVPLAPLLLVPQVTHGFGGQNTSQLGSSRTLAYLAPSTCMFGLSSTPVSGDSRNACASPIIPTFGVSSTPSFIFGYTPFNQVTSAFGGMPFVTTPSPFGAQNSSLGGMPFVSTPSPFGARNSSLASGQSDFGGQQSGSMVAAHTSTNDSGILQSISAMPTYSDKSHEELRWEDYQFGVKGTRTLFPGFMVPRRDQTFGSQREGSGVVAYMPTPDPTSPYMPKPPTSPFMPNTISSGAFAEDPNAKLESISAMFRNKSHEELRWEHYQHGQRGTFSFPVVNRSASVFSTAVSTSSPNPFGSNCSSTTPTLSALFTGAPVQRSSSSSCVNFASSTFPSSMSSITSQGISEQLTSALSSTVMHPRATTNPFGMLPALPHMATDLRDSAPSVQNGEPRTAIKDLLQKLRELEAASQATLRSLLSSFRSSGM